MELNESEGEYGEVAKEEARLISTSLGCHNSDQGGGQEEGGWQQALETPTTQPPAPTGKFFVLCNTKRSNLVQDWLIIVPKYISRHYRFQGKTQMGKLNLWQEVALLD